VFKVGDICKYRLTHPSEILLVILKIESQSAYVVIVGNDTNNIFYQSGQKFWTAIHDLEKTATNE